MCNPTSPALSLNPVPTWEFTNRTSPLAERANSQEAWNMYKYSCTHMFTWDLLKYLKRMNQTWYGDQSTFLAKLQKVLEASGCKPWVTNLSIAPIIRYTNCKYYLLYILHYLNTLISLKWICAPSIIGSFVSKMWVLYMYIQWVWLAFTRLINVWT